MRSVPLYAGLLAAFVLFLGVTWIGCGAFLKNNDAYERGLRAALSDPLVHDLLGEPVYESWFYNGAIESDGMASRGAWSVRVKGSKRAGTLSINAYTTAGEWRVLGMTLKVDGKHYTYRPGQGFLGRQVADPALGPPDILGGAE